MKTTKEVINFFFHQSEGNTRFLRENLQYLSKNQLNWKNNPVSWSVGECISHLIASHKAYLPKLSSAVETDPSDKKDDYFFKNSFFGKLIINGVDPNNSRKVKTQKVFQPASSTFELKIFSEYHDAHEQTKKIITKMKNLDLRKIKCSSPANRFLRMNIGDALIILAIHDTRHLHQAKRVTELSNFPTS